MEVDIVRSVVTVLSFVSFIAVVVWAYAPRRRQRFDRDAMMPFSHLDTAVCRVDSAGVVTMRESTDDRDPR